MNQPATAQTGETGRAAPALPHAAGTLWTTLGGILLGHTLSLWQGALLPDLVTPLDWLLGGATLMIMLGLALLGALGQAGRRTLVSLLIVVNAVFLLGRLSVALFVVATPERVVLDLATLMAWTLTVPMLEASMRTSAAARAAGAGMPLALLVLAVTFALTPQGARAGPVVWFGLAQLCLVCGTVYLSARVTLRLRRALRSTQASNQELARLALTDPLTGLGNRAALDAALEARVETGVPFVTLFLDLDGFKAVNDAHGHAVGDQLLGLVAERLRPLAAGGDLTRVSGDEFVLLLPLWPGADSVAEAAQAAARVVAALGSPFVLRTEPLHLSVSVGVSRFPEDGADGRALLLRADQAMYRVKRRGRGGLHLAGDTEEHPGLLPGAAPVLERPVLERDLRLALARGELQLAFQPICDLRSGRPLAAEALARWVHPASGSIGPDMFVPLAEACGLSGPLGDWVLRTALAEAARWPAAGLAGLTLCVNVSPGQLTQPGWPEAVGRALAESGLTPGQLQLDLTGDLADSSPALSAQVMALRSLGVRVGLDDFGAGLAALAHLGEVALSDLKIDRAYVRGLEASGGRPPLGQTVLQAVVALAAEHGLTLTAEGVETPAQRAALLALGCQRSQGFLFSPPVDATQLAATLRRLQQTAAGPP
ncbi:bifunctional diguanylate cyclase/phosphodiesterase [Deinococcus sp. HMF7604]|uniref:putative bifunctional diguanylate cyclase/phosphodiesterase n=1 Tax=Deinococcus betulae TaxID=2873312 RepID=UPI001CCE9E8A|nr:bifunctional diguanylate cyclase/phosphodiesterase [Deinococcus betulae]MBZ9751300.1 bifunctional diguanylate cyclase/phosphodiesterase [Deinococcus betulae]